MLSRDGTSTIIHRVRQLMVCCWFLAVVFARFSRFCFSCTCLVSGGEILCMLVSFITYLILFTHEFTDRSINLWHPTINMSHLAINQFYNQ